MKIADVAKNSNMLEKSLKRKMLRAGIKAENGELTDEQIAALNLPAFRNEADYTALEELEKTSGVTVRVLRYRAHMLGLDLIALHRRACVPTKDVEALLNYEPRKSESTNKKSEEWKQKRAEYKKNYREKNKEKINAYRREWNAKNKDKVREYYDKARADGQPSPSRTGKYYKVSVFQPKLNGWQVMKCSLTKKEAKELTSDYLKHYGVLARYSEH